MILERLRFTYYGPNIKGGHQSASLCYSQMGLCLSEERGREGQNESVISKDRWFTVVVISLFC